MGQRELLAVHDFPSCDVVNLRLFVLLRALPRDTELSGWSVYDFHEEFARQQVIWCKVKSKIIL